MCRLQHLSDFYYAEAAHKVNKLKVLLAPNVQDFSLIQVSFSHSLCFRNGIFFIFFR